MILEGKYIYQQRKLKIECDLFSNFTSAAATQSFLIAMPTPGELHFLYFNEKDWDEAGRDIKTLKL